MQTLTTIGLIHYLFGVITLASGAGSLLSFKGSSFHKNSGFIFLISMFALALSGLAMSFIREILFTSFLSLLTMYSLATGWATITKHSLGELIIRVSPFLSASIALGSLVGGLIAFFSASKSLDGLPSLAFYVIASIALWASISDFRYIRNENKIWARKVERHLERMSFALLISTIIFFFGNNHVLPQVLRNEYFLSFPVLLVAIISLFYVVKLRLVSR